MMDTTSQLEDYIRTSAPAGRSPQGLRLQVLREARGQAWRMRARRQFYAFVLVAMCCFAGTEFQFRTVSSAAHFVLKNTVQPPESSPVNPLQLAAADIGHWPHVEAVLACRMHSQQLLRHF